MYFLRINWNWRINKLPKYTPEKWALSNMRRIRIINYCIGREGVLEKIKRPHISHVYEIKIIAVWHSTAPFPADELWRKLQRIRLGSDTLKIANAEMLDGDSINYYHHRASGNDLRSAVLNFMWRFIYLFVYYLFESVSSR